MRALFATTLCALVLTACSATTFVPGDGASDAVTSDARVDADAVADSGPEAGAVDAMPDVDASADASDDASAVVDAGPDCGTVSLPPVLTYNLRAAAFPNSGHPDVAVHVPAGFNPWDRVGLVVFFHGFNNCVVNVVGSVNTECTAGAGTRTAMHLADQIDAAGVNAILVAVELRYDQATGDAGALATRGVFYSLLHELLTEHLDALLGRDLDVADFDKLVLASHSGGYRAVAKCLSLGGVDNITEVQLFDSLYGDIATYENWIQTGIDRFDVNRADELKFSDVYTGTGGTDANSRDLAAQVGMWLSTAGLSASFLYDDTTSTLVPEDFLHPVIFKHSALSHDGVPQYYFSRLVAASGFAPLP